ncbi:DNA methyltransferase [Methylobacterium sp. WL120]|nr:DNA methyltransferase [Methylobacterium sp. WL120]
MQIPNWPFGAMKPNSYGMIMADPPWRFATRSEKGRGRSAEQHYDTMTLDEIKALPVRDLVRKEGAFLWLWGTAPMDQMTHEVMEAWGFHYVTQGVWVKTTKAGKPNMGTGYVLRNSHEPYLIGRMGKAKAMSRSVRSAILSPRREHSRKPEQAYADAQLLSGDVPRADLFSRQSRPGWDSWGNEAQRFDLPLAA